MGEGYGVFVQTPPPSETFMIAQAKTREEAMELAIKWGGDMEWQSPSQAISHYGEKVYIEEIRTPLRREDPLRFPRWDEIFETGVFEQYLGPELGLHLTDYGEVVDEERPSWRSAWKQAESWLMNALRDRGIEAYSLQGSAIYPADLKDMARDLRTGIPRGPKDWAPSNRLMLGLAAALQKMMEENK
jgi:hypothetical protein